MVFNTKANCQIMKNKLRRITIEDLVYLYSITDKYHSGTETNTLTVKVFLEGRKQDTINNRISNA